ncbi:MAG: DNA methyltransferase [Candidatus Thorarchaeota archaeon]
MIEFNRCYFIDCLNEENGLPYLAKLIENGEMEKIDLGLTDYPYNLGKSSQYAYACYNMKFRQKMSRYEDKMKPSEYQEFCFKIFDLLKIICKSIVFTCGYKNKQMWIKKRKEKFDELIWVNHHKRGATKISQYTWYEPILVYGKLNYKFKKNVLEYNHGFNMKFDYTNLIHPHPKPRELYKWIIESTRTKSVIDPMVGSGTVLEVCLMLEIPCICYEIEETYEHDIDLRVKGANRFLSQKGMF